MATLVMAPARAPGELATEDLVGSFGPEHSAFPGLRLLLILDGEQVRAAQLELGYRHRGLEKLAERGWPRAAEVAARLDPLAPHAGAAAFAHAREALAGVQPSLRAARLRIAVLELERAASHLGWLARLTALLEARPAARLALQLHRRVVEAGAVVAGPSGRAGGFITPGGVAADVPSAVGQQLRHALGPTRRGLAAFGAAFGAGRLAERRLAGLGGLDAARAAEAGASGPVLRAGGVDHDLRAAGLDPTYAALDVEPVVRGGGDGLARYAVRLAEVDQALNLAERALADLPGGAVRVPVPSTTARASPATACLPERDITPASTALAGTAAASAPSRSSLPFGPAGLAGGRVEGPRGEVGATLVADDDGRPLRVAFRGPSLAHARLLPELLEGCHYADVPLLVASLDLSVEEAER